MAVDEVFSPGERITHHEYGQGVVLDAPHDGYLRAFFGVGERRVLQRGVAEVFGKRQPRRAGHGGGGKAGSEAQQAQANSRTKDVTFHDEHSRFRWQTRPRIPRLPRRCALRS